MRDISDISGKRIFLIFATTFPLALKLQQRNILSNASTKRIAMEKKRLHAQVCLGAFAISFAQHHTLSGFSCKAGIFAAISDLFSERGCNHALLASITRQHSGGRSESFFCEEQIFANESREIFLSIRQSECYSNKF